MMIVRLTQNLENTSQNVQESIDSINDSQSDEKVFTNFTVRSELPSSIFSQSEINSVNNLSLQESNKYSTLASSISTEGGDSSEISPITHLSSDSSLNSNSNSNSSSESRPELSPITHLSSGSSSSESSLSNYSFIGDDYLALSFDASNENFVIPELVADLYGGVSFQSQSYESEGDFNIVIPPPQSLPYYPPINDSLRKVPLLLEKSRKLNKNENIKILSHENFKIKASKKSANSSFTGFETNLIFASEEALVNETFKNIKNKEIDKCESIFDRFILYTDIDKHNSLSESSIVKTKKILTTLDKITTFTNKLETEINYGNIVENFITTNNSRYNGKIINALFKNNNNSALNSLIYKTGFNDDALMDKQESLESSFLTSEDLMIFFNNISGFSIREKNNDFFGSLLNSTIVNSDELVGQLMLNQAIAMYSFYPNTDNINELELFNARKSIINSNALTRYPIIQISHLNINSRIMNDPFNLNTEILNINNGSFRKDSLTIKDSSYLESISSNFYNYKQFINKNPADSSPYYWDVYRYRLSVAGKNSSPLYETRLNYENRNAQPPENLSFRNNNVINIRLKDQNTVVERLYLDIESKDRIKSPTFIIFPERYFENKFKVTSGLGGSLETSFEQGYGDFNVGGHDEEQINKFFRKSNEDDKFINYFYEKYIKNKIKRIYSSLSHLQQPAESNRQINLDVDVSTLINSRRNARTSVTDKTYYEHIFDEAIEKSRANIDISYENVDREIRIVRGEEYSNSLGSVRAAYEFYLDSVSDAASAIGDAVSDAANAIGDFFFGESDAEVRSRRRRQRESNERDLTLRNIGVSFNLVGLNTNNLGTDFFVFKACNSFIKRNELENYSFELYPQRLSHHNDSSSISYLQNPRDRLLNYNSTDVSNFSTTSFIKSSVLSNSNTPYSSFSFIISNFVNLFKAELGKNHTKSFKDLISKCQSKLNMDYHFVLLYDNKEETSIDTFENSPFIFDKDSYKNNFVNSFTEVKNSSERYFTEEVLDAEHIFSSKEYREFLSKIYTNSFARDKTTVFKRILQDNIRIFKSGNYLNNSYFGFDILLATTLLNKNNIDVDNVNKIVKMILSNALMKMSGLDDQISGLTVKPEILDQTGRNSSNSPNYDFYKNLEKVYTKNLAKDMVKAIYHKKNIHCQKNYVFRRFSQFNEATQLIQSISATSGIKGVTFQSAEGAISSLTFPLNYVKKEIPENVIFTDNADNSSEENFLHPLRLLASTLAYDYDIFINEENTGMCFYEQEYNEEEDSSELLCKGYSYSDNLNNTTGDLKIDYWNYKKPGLVSFNKIYDKNGEVINDVTDPVQMPKPDLPYINENVIIPFSYFYLAKQNSTFSKIVTELCVDIMKIFNVDTSSFNNISDVLGFIDQNEVYLKTIKDLLRVYSGVFMDSYENYLTITINQIKEGVTENVTFVGENESKISAVSDIKKILDIISNEEKSLKQDDIFYSYEQFQANNNDLEIYTKRSAELQNVYKILNNCDISTALCHDIIHGYFLNFEDNISSRNRNIEDFNQNIDDIIREINRVERFNIDKKEFIELIKDEFYQNYLSKELQEKVYYKNVFNETFIKNNNYNTNLEKYSNLNVFNTRKLFYENKINQSYSSLKRLIMSNHVRDNEINNLDIIKIPISFKTAKKLSPRGLLKINILPINLKFPEIEYQTLSFYYCPLITNVTSNFAQVDAIQQGVGFFNDTQKITERYSVINSEAAVFEMEKVVEEIIIRKTLSNSNTDEIRDIARKSVNDSMISSIIKDICYLIQNPLDENIKNINFDASNLIDTDTLSLVSSLSLDELVKIFNDYKSNINEFTEISDGIFNIAENFEMIKKQDFYKKFLLNLDEETSIANMTKSMIPNVYYDVFNIIVNRKQLLPADASNVIEIRNSRFNSSESKDKSYNYYISIEVL